MKKKKLSSWTRMIRKYFLCFNQNINNSNPDNYFSTKIVGWILLVEKKLMQINTPVIYKKTVLYKFFNYIKQSRWME